MPRKVADDKLQKPKRPLLKNLFESLGVLFFIIWILIGLFFILYIVAGFRQGAFNNLLSSSSPSQQQTDTSTDAALPGLGKVNVACVQEALSEESIQKIITEQSTDSLTEEEKAKFELCIVEKESPGPATTPDQ